jgi:hypothetical protein
VFDLQSIQPDTLLWSRQLWFGEFSERKVMFRVRAVGDMRLARRVKALERELADGLEHPQARQAIRTVLPDNQAVIDQGAAAVGDVADLLLAGRKKARRILQSAACRDAVKFARDPSTEAAR